MKGPHYAAKPGLHSQMIHYECLMLEFLAFIEM
jgi:hypothetical protein